MATERPDYSLIEIVHRRRWVAISVLVLGLIAVTLLAIHVKPKYGALVHVLLVNDPAGRDPVSAGFDMPTIATSTSVVETVKRELGLKDSVTDLQKAITAHVAPRSSIMTIAFRSKNPDLAIQVPNAIADEFVKFYATLPESRSRDVISAFTRDLKVQRQILDGYEKRLENAASGKTYVGTQTSLDNMAGQLSLLRQQRGVAFSQLVSDQADLASDRTQPGRTAKIVRAEILQNDRGYRALSAAVAQDASQYATTRAGVTDAFPGIRGFEDKVQKEQVALSKARATALSGPDAYSPSQGGQIVATDKAAAAVAGDQAHLTALDRQISSIENELATSGVSGTSNSLGALRAQRDAAEARYDALATRFATAQANVADSSSLGQAVVVDRAVKAEPSILGPTAVLAVGAILVLFAALAAAWIAELVNPKLLSPADVESLYGRPTLATLRTK